MGFCWFLEIIPMIPTVPGHYGRWRSSFGREPPEIGMAGHQAFLMAPRAMKSCGTPEPPSELCRNHFAIATSHDIPPQKTWHLKKNMTSQKQHEISKTKHDISPKIWNQKTKTWDPKKKFPKNMKSQKTWISPKKHEIKNKKNMKSHYIPLIPIQFTLNHPALWLARSRWRDHVAISSGNRGCLVVLVTASSNHGYS